MSNFSFAHEIVSAVKSRQISSRSVVHALFERIDQINSSLNAYTLVLRERAQKRAEQVDAMIASGKDPGPLAGVPFAVKNLFDIKNEQTLAGSKINRSHAPADTDALLVERMENAGAILLGALNMGEYAYDFTGENVHYGNCANPWDVSCMSGGSSSGSGAATASGLAPISLGSDTNGSIRIPASFCGIFGLKPTYGRLPRTGTYPFCDSLDHLGPLARCVKDLAMSFDVLQGYDDSDHACIDRQSLLTLNEIDKGIDTLKIKRASGYFSCANFPQADAAVTKVCDSLGVTEEVVLPGAEEGRAAAYLITNIEGSTLHHHDLTTRANDFDPDTRDRFIAGALLPASWYVRAQQVRQWYHQQVDGLFAATDIIIAPAAPCSAPAIGEKLININGQAQPLRPNLGLFTQPISAIGLPSLVIPTYDDNNNMPVGVQIIAAPWREDWCFRVAGALEKRGFIAKPTPIVA